MAYRGRGAAVSIVTAGVTVALLGSPAGATGKKVTATFPSQASARVTFNVVEKHGKATKVTGVKLKKVGYDCSNDDAGTLTLRVKGTFPVHSDFGDRVVRASGHSAKLGDYQFNLTFQNRAGTKGYGSIPATIKRKHGVTCYTSGAHTQSSFVFGGGG